MLTAYLAARLPGADVTLVDLEPSRAEIAASIGVPFERADAFAARGCAEADVVFHASVSAGGLALAIGSAGMEGSIVEMSWYGEGAVAAPLGGPFHSKRLRLISTQVGQISPSRRPRWDYARRMTKAMELLRDERLDALLDVEVAFEDLPARAGEIFAPGAKGLGVVVRY
jgi:threonine dehydrogenase-like Zn-dependent dehydrogenase